MKSYTTILLLATLLCAQFLISNLVNGQTLAHCLLRGTTNAKGLKGVVTFSQSAGTTNVAWTIDQSTVPTALQGKTLGFHIHEFGYIADAASSGSHYNPYSKNHSLPSENASPEIHVGDLGNIDLSKGYSGIIQSALLQFNGTTSIVGRAIRLHAGADLGKAYQPTGNAGVGAAQCVIGIYNSADNTATFNDQYTATTRAVAVLQKTATASTNITGRIIFDYNSGMTRVYGKICGLPANSAHGMHIHQFGELNLEDGLRTGSHFNPFGKKHGYPGDVERHVGDLGNLTTDSNGVANFDFTVDLIEITNSVRSILGRGLVIHSLRDDGNSSTPTGNAGGRVAIAVIGVPSTSATLSAPVDACVDPAPPADIITPGVSAKTSSKTAVSSSPMIVASSMLILLISLIATLFA